MGKGARTTLKDISRQAKVSIGTVSRVLNRANVSVPISDKTRDKVVKAAADLGYRPHVSARAMRTGRFGAVMLLQDMDSSRTLATSECLAGVSGGLDSEDLHLVYARIPDDRMANDAREPKVFREAMVDGLILNYHGVIPERLIERIEGLGLPWVAINNRRERDCVYLDEVAAGRTSVEHLLGLGHTRIGYLDFNYIDEDIPLYHHSRNDRLSGYRGAMQAAGLEPRLLTANAPIHLDGREPVLEYMRSVLSGPERPTGFVVSNGTEELLQVATFEVGLSVPDDFSLVSFSHRRRAGTLALTSLQVPWEALGLRSVEVLLSRIASANAEREPIVMRNTFIEGETCGPAPQ